jgi:SAM domain (Sterile alpha motif)
MGQFTQPPLSAGLRSPRPPHLSSDTNLQNTTLTAPEATGLPLLSPYHGSGSWASMVNTPMVANFNQQNANQAEMVANATAMKLAALSTVNNRIQLDDVRKYRRTRSTDAQNGAPTSPAPGASFLMAGDHSQLLTPQQIAALQARQLAALTSDPSQLLTPQQAAALQAQQLAALSARRSRPNSPGLIVSGAPSLGGMSFHTPQNSQYLSAFDGNAALAAGLNQFGLGMAGEGYASDHAEMHQRGRSPRGRRGSSKPPEDPTDPSLLQDIPAWLRSLRLHKYTDNLKDLKWQELIEMDDEGLEKRGVAAVGARRKMLKVRDNATISWPLTLENQGLTYASRYLIRLRRRRRMVSLNHKIRGCMIAAGMSRGSFFINVHSPQYISWKSGVRLLLWGGGWVANPIHRGYYLQSNRGGFGNN